MILQAISTKYTGPTNTKGSRISAKCAAKTRLYAWDYSLDVAENHVKAAHTLAKELDWLKHNKGMVSGVLRSGEYCHVFIDKKEAIK